MINAFRDAFDRDVSSCLTETNAELIEVFDCYDCTPTEQRSYIRTLGSQPIHFALKNPQAEHLVFAALDNCLFRSHHPSRCDFVIGNFKKLYFVEIKQVNRGKRRLARANAILQLHSSISFFREKIDFTGTELIAVICLKAKLVYPLQNATRVAEMVAFKENYNATLMEGQSDVF